MYLARQTANERFDTRGMKSEFKAVLRRFLPRSIHKHRILGGPLRGYRIVTSWHDYPDSFIYRDSIFGLAGRRAGASFFALYLDYFIVTRNSQPLPGLGTLSQLHRDPKLCTVYRDW